MEDFIPPNCRSVSLPQMKIGRNENLFPFYLQRQNCGNDRSLPWRREYVYVYYVYVYILYIYQKFHTADSQFYFWMECAHIKIFEVSDYLLV